MAQEATKADPSGVSHPTLATATDSGKSQVSSATLLALGLQLPGRQHEAASRLLCPEERSQLAKEVTGGKHRQKAVKRDQEGTGEAEKAAGERERETRDIARLLDPATPKAGLLVT